MRFFQRKTKIHRSQVEHLNNNTTEGKCNVRRDSRSQPSDAEPHLSIDKRSDVHAFSPPTNEDINNEVRNDISVHTIISSSESSDGALDEMSYPSLISESETPMLKTYVVEHLLGCVDFIEECAEAITIKTFNNRAGCNDLNLHSDRSLEYDQNKIGIMTETVVVKVKPVEFETTEAISVGIKSQESIKLTKIKPPVSELIATMPNKVKPTERATEGTALLDLKQDELGNNVLAGGSCADETVPKSSYKTVAPKTSDDFVVSLAEVDKIIDTHVARLCGKLCVSDDDDNSMLVTKVSANHYEDMLFT
ncbi:hypothetical protein ACHAWX_002127 [Stephanocyclus meneghinianus]